LAFFLARVERLLRSGACGFCFFVYVLFSHSVFFYFIKILFSFPKKIGFTGYPRCLKNFCFCFGDGVVPFFNMVFWFFGFWFLVCVGGVVWYGYGVWVVVRSLGCLGLSWVGLSIRKEINTYLQLIECVVVY